MIILSNIRIYYIFSNILNKIGSQIRNFIFEIIEKYSTSYLLFTRKSFSPKSWLKMTDRSTLFIRVKL